MKITRPSLKRSGFVITSYGCRFGKIPFLIYRKQLFVLNRSGVRLDVGRPLLDMIGVTEIDNASIKKVQDLEKTLDELGITILGDDDLLGEYPFEKK